MKLHILNDIHLEHGPFDHTPPECDAIVLSGDIGTGMRGVVWAKTLGRPVIYVPGNHEFWGSRAVWAHSAAMAEEAKGSNVHFLQHGVAEIDGVRFIGATTWTDFNLYGNAPLNTLQAQKTIGDFKDGQIAHASGRPFTSTDSVLEHEIAKQFICEELAKPYSGKTVVVTHHAPSELSIHPRYQGDPINPAYASRLENIMLDYNPVLWTHGHVHDNFDYMIGDTRVVCNPAGYHGQRNSSFDPTLVIEI